jgi:hypothetical protein
MDRYSLLVYLLYRLLIFIHRHWWDMAHDIANHMTRSDQVTHTIMISIQSKLACLQEFVSQPPSRTYVRRIGELTNQGEGGNIGLQELSSSYVDEKPPLLTDCIRAMGQNAKVRWQTEFSIR